MGDGLGLGEVWIMKFCQGRLTEAKFIIEKKRFSHS